MVVPGHPASGGLTWWVLSERGQQPHIELRGPGANAASVAVHDLARPGDDPSARNAFLVATTNLADDSPYELIARIDPGPTAHARSQTLPKTLTTGQAFTIAIGSCYCRARDTGLANSYPPARFGQQDPIRLRFLTGDQIYMDLSPESGSPLITDAPDPWQRYPDLWQDEAYRAFLSASPNLMMADDHEYWNDYPHSNAWLLWDESHPDGPLGRKMDRAFEVFQVALNMPPSAVSDNRAHIDALLSDSARTFELVVEPLRFFLLDCRTRRTRYDVQQPRFAPANWLNRVVQWLQNLPGPGVLVLPQPGVERRASAFERTFHLMGDVNLPDYDHNFAALWDALFRAPHDVLILSGDIHLSRLYRIHRPVDPDGRKVYELISSPLSRIPSGDPDLGKPHGEIEWDRAGGIAYWTRLYATGAPVSYTTATFKPLGPRVGVRVEVEITAWGRAPHVNTGAMPIRTSTITLE